jgi:3-hydroxyisobutyrate dehydrogenase-like beta-hydroxyacid dehydrogenase
MVELAFLGLGRMGSVTTRLPIEVTLIDAPVPGSTPEATANRLAIYVGAREADLAHVQPVLAPLGSLHHVGGPGAGAATKFVVNLTLEVTMTALGEALALADTLELDRKTLLDILAESPIGTTVRSKRTNIGSGTCSPACTLRLALKDLRLVTESPTEPGRELRLALDYSAVVATILSAESRRATPTADPQATGEDAAR